MNVNLATMTDAEIAALIEVAQDELASRSRQAQPVRVAVSFGAYNERRHSKPWIARVIAWPVGGKPTLHFGSYVGQPGEAGEAEIMAKPGAIVRFGQRDSRHPDRSDNRWGVVEPDGSVREIGQAEASKLYR